MQTLYGLHYFTLVISVMVQLGRPEEPLDSLLQKASTLIATNSIEILQQPENKGANINRTLEIITKGNDPITSKLKQIIQTSENPLGKAEEIKAKLTKLSVNKIISSINGIKRAKGNDVFSESKRVQSLTEDATGPGTKGATGQIIGERSKNIPMSLESRIAAGPVIIATSIGVEIITNIFCVITSCK